MAEQKKKSDARRITLRFPATCKSCGTELPVGSKVTWYPGGTVYGMDCHKSPFATAKPKGTKKVTPKSQSTSTPSAPAMTAEAVEKLKQLSAIINTPNQHKQFLKMLGQ